MEKIVEEISFEADAHQGETYTVTKALIEEKIGKAFVVGWAIAHQ